MRVASLSAGRGRDHALAGLTVPVAERLAIRGQICFELRNERGVLVAASEDTFNLIVNEGLQYIGDSGLGATIYMGLLGTAPTVAAGNTMASHAGWTEVHSIYSEANRPTWSKSRTNQTWSNSAAKARFTFTGSGTVGGLFLATNNTKNGTTGTLLAGKAFSGGDLSVANGYTLDGQYDLTLTAS